MLLLLSLTRYELACITHRFNEKTRIVAIACLCFDGCCNRKEEHEKILEDSHTDRH